MTTCEELMRKLWLVAKHEYLNRVSKPSFLLSTLGLPFFIVLVIGISILIAINSENVKPVGIVDQANLINPAALEELEAGDTDDYLEIRPFADQEAAQTAVENQEIQGYYLIPENYLQTFQISVYYLEDAPGAEASRTIRALLRANLVADLPGPIQQRVFEGPDLAIRSADETREISQDSIVNFVFPFAAGFLFIITVMSSAGYLLQVVTDEKVNRTVEIIITSLSPEQLIAGKAFGLMAVSITQIIIWTITVLIGLLVASQFFEALQTIQIPWGFLLVMVMFFFPTFAFIAGLMTAIGGAVTELRHGQQIAGLINLLFMLPYLVTTVIIANPNHPFVVALTLFPTTSYVTITLRWAMSSIPAWQFAISWLLLVVTSGLSIWASARIFRAGMLRYGQNMRIDAVLEAIRTGRRAASQR